MTAGDIERDIQIRFAFTYHGKLALLTILAVIFNAHVGIIRESVGDDLAANSRNKLTNHWIINAQNRLAIKR
ncbi:Uncharacterised protein [Vibrio cholerae]|uniref:Uncharacterized protein n=1 Tax=Vibrio cholerae TaxID=666 RepID=A0A655W148_VIBCL|nr:Uncharacterised protein [Vibrio cholerae]